MRKFSRINFSFSYILDRRMSKNSAHLKIRPGEPYSFTINPNYWQQNYSICSITERCQNFMDRFEALLERLDPGADGIRYKLYPDASQPLDQVGAEAPFPGTKMHLHGVIFFENWHAVRVYFYRLLPKLINVRTKQGGLPVSASVSLDTISSMAYWVSYCRKAMNTMWPDDTHLTNMSSELEDWIYDWIPTLPTYVDMNAGPIVKKKYLKSRK